MVNAIDVKPLPGYRIWVRYGDGAEGEVDLSELAGKGVFSLWDDPANFERVRIGSGGQIVWNDEVEICADAAYLRITGRSPEEVFPGLKKEQTHA
jgi:hypothetical protein